MIFFNTSGLHAAALQNQIMGNVLLMPGLRWNHGFS